MIDLIKKMSLTEILAFWGAILSTILGVLKILEYRRDRPNIKVTVKGNMKVFPQITPYGNANLLVITAANISRRNVTLTTAALLMPRSSKTKYLLCSDSVSKAWSSMELKEGQARDYIMDEDVLKKEHNLTADKYVACVSDATGKYYWSCNWLKRLIKLGRIK